MSLRARLTLVNAGAMTVILALYAAGTWTFLEHRLSAALDRQLHEDYELAERMIERSPGGGLRLRPGETGHHEEAHEAPFFEVRTPAEDLLLQSAPRKPAGRLRTYERPHRIGGTDMVIRVARSEEPLLLELRELALVLGFALPVGVGISSLGGYALARRALAPVDALTEQARSISADRLSERLPVRNPGDELGRLATVFNDAFGRLERSFEQLRRFTADASHELRTPLAALRSIGEVALNAPRDAQAYRDAIGSMLEEVARLNRLVESLLTLARADGGQVRLNLELLDLTELAREVTSHLGVLAEEKRQALTVEAPRPVPIRADRAILRQAVVNLLHNAIRYSPEGTPIRVSVGDGAVLEVADRGPGIPPEHLGRIFDRFYRVDAGRSRDEGGTGLGLSIARWAVEIHGGTIEVESIVGEGSRFRIRLAADPKGGTA
ncbi:MAG: HAMP domain-containing protein [Planctomycetes bacterium]|nr:HAMP domain-containing protein [Planctomycetota bacterium]